VPRQQDPAGVDLGTCGQRRERPAEVVDVVVQAGGPPVAELPDVPPATLYRHVAVLSEAGVLAVVGERRVRGAAERSYRLVTEAASVGATDAAGMSVDEHRRAFATFVTALLADFDRYADAAPGPEFDPAADGVGYRQVALWLDDEEFTGLVTELREVLAARLAFEPDGVRRRRIVSQVFLPG
jgi:hypothetical protein